MPYLMQEGSDPEWDLDDEDSDGGARHKRRGKKGGKKGASGSGAAAKAPESAEELFLRWVVGDCGGW